MKELNEEDINEKLNDEEGIMKELTEEEMKNEGGACMRTPAKPGFIRVATRQKRGWYKVESSKISGLKTATATLTRVSVNNPQGGSPGNPVITNVALKNDGLYIYTPYGTGSCSLDITVKSKIHRASPTIRIILNIDLVLK